MSRSNPFRKISSQDIYENPWIKVVEDQIIKPNNEPGIYGKLHFKNYAIGIVALEENHDVWMVGQYRYILDTYTWEIPTGGGSKDVSGLDGAKRELREETGLTAGSWEDLIHIHLSNSVTDEFGMIFLAQDLTPGPTDFDDTEILEIKKIPFQEALSLVMDHTITDSMTVSGILAASHKLGITINK